MAWATTGAVHQPGQQVVAEVPETGVARRGVGAQLGVQFLESRDQHLGVVDHDLGRHRRRGGLVGLVGETGDGAVVRDLQAGVVAGLLQRAFGGHHGAGRSGVKVGADRVLVVEAVDVVGAEHQEYVGPGGADPVAEPVELVGVAAREALLVGGPGAFLRHHQPQPAAVAVEVPGAPVGHLLLEAGPEVGHREPHIRDAAVREVGQGEVDELVDPGERQRRLGPLTGQHVHAVARTSGLDEGEDAGARHAGHGDMPVHGARPDRAPHWSRDPRRVRIRG